jgi:NhaA family Na+:H+ antiporter
MKIRNLLPYLIGGGVMWYYMLHSGIHATITGVMLAFAIPFGNGDKKSSSYLLQRFLHKPVAFLILPLFALANTAILVNIDLHSLTHDPVSLGILIGLVVGKPAGILIVCFLAVKAGFCKLPSGLHWKHIAGAGLLAGIGFTMSIFITLLAFSDGALINNAKFVILISAALSGILGFIWLKIILKKARNN